jgi:hypothetical protein
MIDDSDAGNTFGNYYFLDPAKAGDWGALADYLERGGPVTPAMRKFLAEILRGEKRRPRRPRRAATQTRALEVGGYVELQRQEGARDPIRRAEKLFQVSRRSVQTAARAFDKLNAEQKAFVTAARDGWTIWRRGAIK